MERVGKVMDYPPIELDQRTFDCAGEGENWNYQNWRSFRVMRFYQKKKKKKIIDICF